MPFGQPGRNMMMGAGQSIGQKMGGGMKPPMQGGMKPQPMPMQKPVRPMPGQMGQGAPMGLAGRVQGAGGLAPSAMALGGIIGGQMGMRPPVSNDGGPLQRPNLPPMPQQGPPMEGMSNLYGTSGQAQGPPMQPQGGGFGPGPIDPQILQNLMQARQQQMQPPQQAAGFGQQMGQGAGIGPSPQMAPPDPQRMMRRPMMRGR